MCDYIYWAKQSNLELFFQLSDQEYKKCLLTKERGVYAEFMAHEELTALPSYQMMSQLSEIASIINGDIDWTEAEILT